jgi:hypothetical protein
MERRLYTLGVADVRVEWGTTKVPGRLLRAFVLSVPATEYAAVFPPLERGTPKGRNTDAMEEQEEEEGE